MQCCNKPFAQQQDADDNKQNNRDSNYGSHHHGGVVLDLRLSCTETAEGCLSKTNISERHLRGFGKS